MLPQDHNIWVLLFEQTPAAFRWIFGILTFGIYFLAQKLYTNHKERVNRLENLIVANANNTNENIKSVHAKIDKLTLSLIDKGGS